MDISNLLEVEVKEGKVADLQNNGEIAAYKNIPDFSIRDIASVRFRKLHCTACDLHIGSAPSEAHNMHEHPVLRVLLCTACRNFYGDGTFEQGDDATDMFCRWCANGGNLYCCSYCSNTFCYNCIKRNFDPMIRKKIERDPKWKCFVCNPADLYTARAACWALLQHVQTVTRILQSDRKMSAKEIEAKMNLDESQCCPHRNKRKRSETISDDDDEDEAYNIPKRKRRKLLNAKRRRRVIKLEMEEGASGVNDASSNRRSFERLGIRDMENSHFMDAGNNGSRIEETASLSPEDLPLAVRQKNRRSRPEPIETTNFSMNDDEIPAPLLECDQTMIEGAESLTFDNTSTEPPHNIGISTVPMVNLMKWKGPPLGPLTRGGKTHRLVRGRGGTPVLVRKIAPKLPNHIGNASSSLQCLPMVTIPSVNQLQPTNCLNVIQTVPHNNQEPKNSVNQGVKTALGWRTIQISGPSAPRILGNSKTSSSENATPSVIDLDSDSDEPVVLVTPSRERRNSSSNDRASGISTITYPVRPDDGLMTILAATPRHGDERNEPENRGEKMSAAKTFDTTLGEPTKSIDSVLDSFKGKLKKAMESAMLFSPDKELLAAKAKTRAVNRTIKRTVAELTALNDNLVRAYHAYKRDRTKEKVKHTETIVLEPRKKSVRLIPLDMECTRESEPEFDETISEEDCAEQSSDDSSSFRIIRPSRKRVHRAVSAKPDMENKSVQVQDVELRDCETFISYALLLKADYDPKRQRDVLRPVIVPDENFGKYEEEFINYLQHIEDNGIETEELKASRTQSQPCVSVNQLVEADLSKIIRELSSAAENGSEITRDRLLDDGVEILEEHVEIITDKSNSSGDELSSSHFAKSSENEGSTTTSTATTTVTTSPEKKEDSPIEGERKDENVREKNKSHSERTNPEKKPPGTFDDTKKPDSTVGDETGRIENDGKTSDEETVLAVRALIGDDHGENPSDTGIHDTWKSVDSDDECTILN